MANLLVEIGNTALKAAWSEGTTLGKTFRYQGEKTTEFILKLIEKEYPDVLTVSSVRLVSSEEEQAMRQRCTTLILLDAAHPETLGEYGLPEYISYDRAAGLIAARFLFEGKNCCVFDFGTTITIDLLDSDGRYIGGNISPGCRTRFKALNRYSRTLPLVNTPEETQPLGTSLKASIESGVVLGIKFEIEGYMASNPDAIMVFTGGDANYLAKKMKNSIFAVSNLVLMGLAKITEDYVRKN